MSARTPGGLTTTYHHGPAGTWMNTDSVRTPLGRTAFTFDAYGRTATVKNPLNQVAATQYDSVNRVRWVRDALSRTTRFTYGSAYLTRVRDAESQTWSFHPNVMGWDTARVDPRGRRDRYVYNVLGQVELHTDRRGVSVTREYDHHNRLARVETPDGSTIGFTYDEAGLTVVGSNAESTDTLVADSLGRIVREVAVRGGRAYTVWSTYDENQRRAGVTLAWPSVPQQSRTTSYAYSAADGLLGTISYAGYLAALRYDADRRPVALKLPGADTVRFDYGATGLLSAIRYRDPYVLDPALGVRYRRDALGRITRATRADGADSVARAFRFDAAGQLAAWADSATVAGNCRIINDEEVCDPPGWGYAGRGAAFTYDSVGNRTDQGAVLQTGNRLTAFAGYALEWDSAGNLARKSRGGFDQRFWWSAAGQLDSVSTNGAKTRFGYDAFGRRVRQSSGAATTGYVYDGGDLVLELDGTGGVLAQYAHYPGIDQPFAMERSGSVYYYLREAPGHVSGLIGVGGSLINRYRYGPWGETERADEGVANPFRFTAREYDAATKLYYFRARYYDPELGRFINEDPIGLAGGINPYRYAQNDPVNHNDPTGLFACPPYTTCLPPITGVGRRRRPSPGPPWGDNGDGWMDELEEDPFAAGRDSQGEEREWRERTCTGGFDEVQCRQIRDAITFLQQHAYSLCREIGTTVQRHFIQGRIGWDPSTHLQALAYRGYARIGQDALWLTPGAFWRWSEGTETLYLPNTLSHEEAHLLIGPGHAADQTFAGVPSQLGAPDEVGDRCGLPPLNPNPDWTH